MSKCCINLSVLLFVNKISGSIDEALIYLSTLPLVHRSFSAYM